MTMRPPEPLRKEHGKKRGASPDRKTLETKPKGLTVEGLAQQSMHLRVRKSGRVVVRDDNGTQIGLLGVGQESERLTFPTHWAVCDVLNGPWARFKTEEDTGVLTWYALLGNKKPTALYSKDHIQLGLDTAIGQCGHDIIAKFTPMESEMELMDVKISAR